LQCEAVVDDRHNKHFREAQKTFDQKNDKRARRSEQRIDTGGSTQGYVWGQHKGKNRGELILANYNPRTLRKKEQEFENGGFSLQDGELGSAKILAEMGN